MMTEMPDYVKAYARATGRKATLDCQRNRFMRKYHSERVHDDDHDEDCKMSWEVDGPVPDLTSPEWRCAVMDGLIEHGFSIGAFRTGAFGGKYACQISTGMLGLAKGRGMGPDLNTALMNAVKIAAGRS